MDTLAIWHDIVRTKDMERLQDLLAEDVVFHSPVVHTPVQGRPMTALYLAAAAHLLATDDFTYVREVVGERDAVLEFVTEVEGIQINGVDMLRWDDQGRIVDFKVMVRPKKAFELVHRKMRELLEAAST